MEDDFASVSTQDNGTVLYRDNLGNVTYAQDQAGNPIAIAGAAGSGIVQQAMALLNYGVRSAIDARYKPPQVVTPTGAVVSGLPQVTGSNILVLASLGLLAFKLLAK